MAWAIITIYISKCAQMNPQQLPKTSKFYSKCKKCDIEKTLGVGTTPLGSPKVKPHSKPFTVRTSDNLESYLFIYVLTHTLQVFLKRAQSAYSFLYIHDFPLLPNGNRSKTK